MPKSPTTPPKLFELTLTIRDPNNRFQPISFDKIEDDNLVSLLGQFMICLISAQRTENEIKRKHDEDIPF